MLIDVRTYVAKIGMLPKHLELYKTYGFAVQCRHLGNPLAILTTETGHQNEYVHMWVFESAADREQRRGALAKDPEWQDYLKKARELGALIRQDNRLMTPVEFAAVNRASTD